MGVYYSANFGIEMQIKYPSDESIISLNIGCEDWFDYFNKITKNTDFEYIQYGSDYDDEEMKCAIILMKNTIKHLICIH